MAERYSKTEKGRIEIRTRAQTLSRTARNLLLIIDSSRSLPEWLAMVQGSTAQDGAALIEAGLIESATRKVVGDRGVGRAVTAPAAVESDAAPLSSVSELPISPASTPASASTGLGYVELYDGLNALVKETLGLFKGYRFSLEIERARDLQELQVVAQRFVDEVAKTRGESVARVVRRALGL
jgi:hypothetical protein